MKTIRPASEDERARLRTLDAEPLSTEEFLRRVSEPMSDAEREDALALVAWFTRRYPTGAERLAYVRRAWRRWNAALPRKS